MTEKRQNGREGQTDGQGVRRGDEVTGEEVTGEEATAEERRGGEVYAVSPSGFFLF